MSDQPQDPQAVTRYMPAYDRDSTMRTVAYMEPSLYGMYVRLDAYDTLRKAFAAYVRDRHHLAEMDESEVEETIAEWVESVEAK